MSGHKFLVDASELEYDFSGSELSNSVLQEFQGDLPSVTYLKLNYEGDILIPASALGTQLAPLQALVKYLKEEKGMTNKQVSLAIKRDVRTVWLTYSLVRRKPFLFDRRKGAELPLAIFSDEKLSVLEAAVSYMHSRGMPYAEIARKISRDQRTVWTVMSRARKKLGLNNGTK